jgi:capsular polysaccharide export protein
METDQSNVAGFSLDKFPGYRRVLFLQGPVGPFFHRFARLLEQRDTRVTKVNFNSGDDWFYPRGDVVRFSGTPAEWPAFLQTLVADGNYEAIFLFGDCRPIHRPVGDIAAAAGCPVWVFEEGYFRPSYITLERGGVNGYSSLVKLDLAPLRQAPVTPVPKPILFPNAFRQMAWQAFIYFLMLNLGAWRYPYYVHHRPRGFIEAFRWIRSWVRKTLYSQAEAGTINRILSPERKHRFFVFPLQVHNDAQLRSHSDSPGVHLSLRHVMKSFAQNASREDWLVIKHHPMDRGHTNYSKIIRALISEFGLAGRVHYVHDVRLPALFDNCKGLVTVNSTAGLQGMDHNLPVIALGRSFYNRPGLTYQGGLDSFWTSAWKPDFDLYVRFRARIILTTQINSSFYADPNCGSKRLLPSDESPAGELEQSRFLGPPAVNRDIPSIRPPVTLQSEPGAAAMPGC